MPPASRSPSPSWEESLYDKRKREAAEERDKMMERLKALSLSLCRR